MIVKYEVDRSMAGEIEYFIGDDKVDKSLFEKFQKVLEFSGIDPKPLIVSTIIQVRSV